MPITIGTMTSRVNAAGSSGPAVADPEQLESLVKLVAMRLRQMEQDGGDEGAIPDRRTDSR